MLHEYINHYKEYKNYIKPLNNIANQNNIFPNNINKLGYYKIANILSYYKPFLYKGEHWKSWEDSFCVNENFNQKKNKNSTRIITFNVHNWTKRCGMASNVTKNISNKLAKNINIYLRNFKNFDADILCLQEITPIFNKPINKNINDKNYIKNNLNFKYLTDEMNKIGYKYSYIVNTQHSYKPIPADYEEYFILGNAIFSKIPIKNVKGYKLPGNRAFIECIININNKDVLLYTTHLDYFRKLKIKELINNNFNKTGPFNNITNLQLDLLVLHILDTMNKYKIYNVILCGDFNKQYIPSLDNKNRKLTFLNFNLLLNFFKDSYNICYPDIKTYNKKRITNFSRHNTTDYIFISKYFSLKIDKCKIIKTDISDHYPVMIDIK